MQMKTTTISHYTKSNTDDTAAGEDVERQELSFVAGGMQNGTAILEDWLAVSHKTKHIFITQSSNCAPQYLPKGVKNFCQYKIKHVGVFSSVFYNCPNLEATKMAFFGEWVDYGTPRQWKIIQSWKEMSYQAMKIRDEILNAYY